MNAAVGIAALGQGGLAIAAQVADGCVCAVRISSSRPTNLSRLFIGRPAEEAPLLAERIFSLCGVSHRVVSARAIASARGETICLRRSQDEAVALLAERLGSTLRASVIMLLNDSGGADLARIGSLGEILSILRDLCVESLSRSTDKSLSRRTAKSLIRGVCALGRDHGLRSPRCRDGSAMPGGRVFENLEVEFASGDALAVAAPDWLSDADDFEIIRRMREQGETFAAAPSLPGRAPETGAFARQWRATDLSKGALAARFEARMIDLAECFDRLESAEKDEPAGACGISPAVREGSAAVETSRGRLYHWVRLSPSDRIQDYRIVAPTEWNFHPAGPFVEALLGAAVGSSRAERRIVQLASLIDPCVPFRVEVKEHGRA